MIPATEFGKLPNGQIVRLHTLENRSGLRVRFTDYGGIITEIRVPDRRGKFGNVALACPDLAGYLKGHPYFGALTGRVCNRISGARFTLDGQEYALAANNGANCLHGGKIGFDKVQWEAQPLADSDGCQGVRLRYRSADGEEGFPGNLDATADYSLNDAGEFRVRVSAVTDKATPVNITQHNYFNLSAGERDVMGHILTLNARLYAPSDPATLIPTGEIVPVAGTAYDFRMPKRVGLDAGRVGGGYDNSFVIDRACCASHTLVVCAHLHDPDSGRTLETLTDKPIIHVYTGNSLDGTAAAPAGMKWTRHMGMCFETQDFTNAINQPKFPSTVLRPGEVYGHTCVYRFGIA